MTIHDPEERALEVMRKQLAAEPVPELEWKRMEREFLARLDEAPMTTQPKSLDAQVDDVPASIHHPPRRTFARAGAFVLAMAAGWALFWISPLRRGEPIVVSTASSGATASAVCESPPAPVLTIESVKAALAKCRHGDKPAAGKLTITLESGGQIDTVKSDPPLDPAAMHCLLSSIRDGRFNDPPAKPITISF